MAINKKSNNKTFFLNILIVSAVLAIILWFTTKLFINGLYPLATIMGAVALLIAMVYLRKNFSPMKWLSFGIVWSLLFTVYPIFYTCYISVTNMGNGHLMSKEQVISRLEEQVYLPEDTTIYRWAIYQTPEENYSLWLISEDQQAYFITVGEPLRRIEELDLHYGSLDEKGFPLQIEGFTRLSQKSIVQIIDDLGKIEFGEPPLTIHIQSLSKAAAMQPLYEYDKSRDILINQQTGDTYSAVDGTFISESGEALSPGYIVFVGFRNFEKFLGNKGYRDPLGKIIIWNFAFAILSVFISLAIGMIASIMFEDLPGKRIIRSLLIIPWPIPVLVSVLIWRYMLHPDLGFIAQILESIFGSSPQWFQETNWTRFALILVNVWLSYPYFYVITSGALRAIPEEIYSSAIVDGANGWQQFRYITFPLVMRIITPILIASLTFNFNNFNVIFIFNMGYPPMPNTVVPMGYTDILISVIYRIAFVASNVADYGLAAAMTIMLFLLVSIVVVFQIRSTKVFAEE